MRMTLRSAAFSLALAAAGVGVAAVALPAPPAVADATDDAIKALMELAAGDDDNKTVAKIVELEGSPHEKVTKALVDVAKSHKTDRVAIAAMRQAAGRKSPDLFKWLKTKIDDDKMMEKRPELYKAVLGSLAKYPEKDKKTLDALADVIKKGMGDKKKVEFAVLAIAAYGTARDKTVVDELIKWLVQSENTSGGQGGKSMSDDTREAYGLSKQAFLKALEDLTLQAIGDGKTWTEWWDGNRKLFTFPDPNAPEQDLTKITEFTDTAYGWTVKKPEGQFWAFAKQEEDGHRIELNYRDDQNIHWARLRAFVWKAFSDAPSAEAKVKQTVKHWTPIENEPDKKPEFSAFSKGGEPKVEPRKVGGKEFWVGTARGIGDGSWKGWEGCERRVYVHQLNTSLHLYFDVVVKSGADDAVKAAIFGAMEGVTFKK